MSTSTEQRQAVDYRLMRRLLRFLRPYRSHIAGAVVLTLTSSALGPLRPYLTRIAVDEHIVKGDLDGLLWFVGIIFSLLLLQGAMQYALSIALTWIGQHVLLDIRTALYRHVQRLALRYYDTTPVGRIVTRVTNDVETLNELFSQGIVSMIADVMTIVWILAFMLNTSVVLTGLTIIILPLLLIASFVFRAKVRTVYSKIRTQVARMNSFMNEFVSGIGIVQLFRQERRMMSDFGQINREHRTLQDRSIMYYATFYPVVEFLSMTAVSVVLFYAARHVATGEITIGVIIMFFQYTEMFFRPVRDLSERYNILQSSVVASERIFDLLDTDMRVNDAPDAQTFTGLRDGIDFRDVRFSYDGNVPVLNGVSFRVGKGETVALVGATGAGKSSIINLLARFYEYQDGDILIDGRSIRAWSQDTLRRRIAIVLQDVFLFSRDVSDNISLRREDIDQARVEEAAKRLGAYDFISRLPHGFQTNVRERGAVLSVGQKQLISFCRALASDPDILILDEATSSIDTETEQLIERSIRTLLAGRTSIVVAHRLSTIQRADRIIVLHHGEIVEQGSHAELLEHNGYYAKLHRLQFMER
ncbi:MAG: ABC transporter ATP-binding protein [Candidatus Kapabacteria bacterium]|nr:ABC transporter ATP-binding protein [Candidatus Kapabacteria bacterium]